MAKNTQTGGRDATVAVVLGDFGLSIGNPGTPTPAGFEWRPLSSLARLESGHTPSRKKPEYWDGGTIPWIGIRDATGNHGRTIFDTQRHVTQSGIDNSSARVLPADTVCLSRTASVGYVVTMGAPMATSQDFVNWVCGPELDHRYLHYLLMAEQASVRKFAYGSVHQTLYYPDAKALHVCVPHLEEQQRIASVLVALDDLIETDRQAIQSIDSQAEAIFERSMAESESVEVVTLSQLVARGDLVLSDGYRTRADQLSESGIPILRVADVLDAEISPSYKDRILESFRPRMGFKVSQVHDVLITTKGTVGRIALVPPGFPEHAYSPQLCFLRATNAAAFSPSWLYRWARSAEFLRQIGIVKDQTDMAPYVSLTDLRRVEMTVPTPSARRAAEAKLVPLTAATEALRDEIADVMTTRDELLPLLMSGKVRVSEDLAVA